MGHVPQQDNPANAEDHGEIVIGRRSVQPGGGPDIDEAIITASELAPLIDQ